VDLSGHWIVELKTTEGILPAKMELRQDGRTLFAALWVDNHTLQGSGETDGEQFEIVVSHSDGTGPGHSEHIRLTGKLNGNMIAGQYDNGTDRGAWTASRS
jgi:hypothetical protein